MMTSTTRYRAILVDTGAFIALAHAHDSHHSSATRFHHSLARATLRVTTWAIIAESHTWLRYHAPSVDALKWLGWIERVRGAGSLAVVYPDAELDTVARAILARYDDQRLSYTDALTLAVMQRERWIEAIFAFDRHMLLAGKPVLPGAVQ